MANAGKKMGKGSIGQQGGKGAGHVPAEGELSQADLAQEEMGNNQLQGDDQENVHNQRHAQPDAKDKADGIIEGLKKQDKDERARRDLGKGARHETSSRGEGR